MVGDETYLNFSARHHHGAAISTSYADCDGDGVLSWPFDFALCYYQIWAAEDISADCNGDNEVDTYDLTCFSTLFTAGCP